MKIAVTGGFGFLGWHIRARCIAKGITTAPIGRHEMGDPQALDAALQGADLIVHAAGVNRAASDAEIADGNHRPAKQVADALARVGSTAPLVYTNSTQSEREGVYGDAKRAAATVLFQGQADRGASFVDLVLPHLFGEFGRPNYNSAVTTFAHALATKTKAQVHRDGQLELVHAQHVADLVVNMAETTPSDGSQRVEGRQISVGDVWDTLEAQHARYVNELTIPRFVDLFELRLFNTLRSQLFAAGYYPQSLTVHRDQRGGFAELCRADGVGQTSVSTSVPGVSRGDHFHFDKIERFVVLDGHAVIRLRRLLTDEVVVFEVDGRDPVFIDMPPLTTHNITNTGADTLTTLFWSGDHFDPENPDTFVEKVEAAL